MSDSSSSSPPGRSPAASARSTSGAAKRGGSSGPAAKVTARTRSRTARRPPPKRPCSTSPARATPRPSPRSCAPGSTGRSPWCWPEGYQALLRWRGENEITGLYAVPYDVEAEAGVTQDFPLGRWVHQQRKALRAGELGERRKTLLDAPEAGMVWEPGEEAWEAKLAVLRCYRRATGHLAPVKTPCGARARPRAWCPSVSTWPTSAGRAASARTRNGRRSVRSIWPRSTRTGTAPGR
uniref:helicase associated domain-containing protein n=1 Tax=Streptomyces calvus TaxID=67282 RepID=UPI003F80D565